MLPVNGPTAVAPSLASDTVRIAEKGAATTAVGGSAESTAGVSFQGVLESAVMEASSLHADATRKATEVAAGTLDDLHGTAIAMKESEISLKLVGQIRNKLLDAFHELWRTNV